MTDYTNYRMVDLAMVFATAEHAKIGQLYDGKPYTEHLNDVADVVRSYRELIGIDYWLAQAGAYVHDLIEDCRVTYNDVAKATSKEVAEISYLLATPKGRTRLDRHCDEYYLAISYNKVATFVKLADRLANAAYSKKQGSTMLAKYRQELPHFRKYLRPAYPEFEPMWIELENLLS